MAQDSSEKSVWQIDSARQDFLNVASQASEKVGSEYFLMLVKELRHALGARCVYVGEFVGRQTERVHTLAACMEGDQMKTFEFAVAGSPDAEVALGNPSIYSKDLRQVFPGDIRLRDLDVDSYVGIPLNTAEGQACGLLVALYGQSLGQEIQLADSLLRMFAPRAAAELIRKRERDSLRESEQRYRAFIELNTDALWRVEFEEPIDTALTEEEQLERIQRTGYVAECNDALAKSVGRKRAQQLIGATLAETVPNLESADRAMRSLIRSGYRYSVIETTPIDCEGNRRHYLRSHWGIVENGKLQRIWGSHRDITELRALEAQFRHAQKLDAIGRLAGGVAHDFNNLLSVIHGYSSQLLESTEKTEKAYVGLTEIQKSVEKGTALTRQLLALSRKQRVRPQLLDLNAVVAEDERMLRTLIGAKIELTMDLDPSLGMVLADTGYMHQVLLNLAVNARDAMPNGGKLSIALHNMDIDETRPTRHGVIEPGPYVKLMVTDTGVGMSEVVQEHLFEPFFTTKAEGQGTGLGLSVVYGIVRQNGGQIVVASELNKGTQFEVFLPRVESREAAPGNAPPEERPKTSNCCFTPESPK
jgi:signal transduction histidine kinase